MRCAGVGEQVRAVAAADADEDGQPERRPERSCGAREGDRRRRAAEQPVRCAAVLCHGREDRHRCAQHATGKPGDEAAALQARAAVDSCAGLVGVGQARAQQRGADGCGRDEAAAVHGGARRQCGCSANRLMRPIPHVDDPPATSRRTRPRGSLSTPHAREDGGRAGATGALDALSAAEIVASPAARKLLSRCGLGLGHRIGHRANQAPCVARCPSLQTLRFAATFPHGRGGFRTCDLSRVKRALSH